MKALAARCGSEVPWAASWEEAAARARAERKPILVHARIYPGFALSDDTLVGNYMEPHVVALVRERYVPFKLKRSAEVPFADPDLYGLSSTTFGTSTLLVTPEGEVLAEEIGPLYTFLVRGLTLDPELAGPEFEAPADPWQAAAARLARGEHAAARALIEDLPAGARRAILAADLALRERDVAAARDLLLAQGDALAGSGARVDLALAHLYSGEAAAGRALLEEHVASDEPRVVEARFWLGSVQAAEEPARAAEPWRALIAEHPADRWAWRAAGALTSTVFSTGQIGPLELPPVGRLAMAAPFEPGPLPASELERAERDAIEFLLAHQRPSGAWTHASARPEEPDDLRLAITSICGSALLPFSERPEVTRAVERGLEFVLMDYRRMVEQGEEIWFMDYAVWSRPYALAFLGDCVLAEIAPREDLAPVAKAMIADLERKQRSNGGWSYYVTGDTEGTSAPEHSISFTTAAVILGLVRGDEAGFQVPEPLLERALDCLEAMRDSAGNFEYFLWVGSSGGGSNPEPGAAGRGPVCELALLRGGRGEKLDPLRRALGTFARHRRGLMAEQGKALMHCGTSGQGSHYLCFDYATAAMAVSTLPPGEREKHRGAVIEALLAARGASGGFLDNPLLGWAAGTGLALHALHALR